MDRPTQHQPREAQVSAQGTLAAIGAIVLWCWSGVCYAAGARAMGAMPYLAITSAVGVLTIVTLYAVRGRSVTQLFTPPVRVMVAGFFGVAVYSVLLVEALAIAPDRDLGAVMLLNYLWPIGIVLLGMMLLPGRPRVGQVVLGALLGFAGVVVARGSLRLPHQLADYLPHVMALAGAVLWSLYSVLLRHWQIPAEQNGSTFHFAVCTLLAAVLATLQGAWRPLNTLDASSAWWVLFGGIGPVGLAYYWWEIGVKRGSVHLIALLAYFIPIGSATLIGVFFQEAMGPGLIPGAAMIAVGAWLGHRAARGRQASRTE